MEKVGVVQMDKVKVAEKLMVLAKELMADERELSEVNIKINDGKCVARVSYYVMDGATGRNEKISVRANSFKEMLDKLSKL